MVVRSVRRQFFGFCCIEDLDEVMVLWRQFASNGGLRHRFLRTKVRLNVFVRYAAYEMVLVVVVNKAMIDCR